jgi:hypothetical protein
MGGYGFSGNSSDGGATSVITTTKAGLLALISSNAVDNATYKITDISGFEAVFVQGIAPNVVNGDAVGLLIAPSYVVSGDNLGQMDFSSIPSVGVGEYVIWGDYYWKNNTASPITPTITDDVTLGGGLTKLAKTSSSIYDVISVECSLDASLNIGSIYNASNDNTFSFSPPVLFINPNVSYLNSPLSHPLILSSDVTLLRNYKSGNPINGEVCNALSLRSPYRNSLIASNVGGMSLTISGDELNTVKENKGRFFDISITGSNNTFQGNIATLDNNNNFTAIELVNTSRFTGNIAIGGKSSFPNASNSGIGYIELFDNCEMLRNECNGESSVIWDLRTGENCQMNDNIINSNAVTVGNVGVNDIDQMQFDEVNGNVLNGDDVVIEMINMLGYSKFNNNTFNGTLNFNTRWGGFQMLRSEITDNTINANNIQWRDIWMSNAKIRNAVDIQIQDVKLKDIDLDLTGFTQDIIAEQIETGKGFFTIKRDFTVDPLVVGVPVLLNLIPTGARVTSIKAVGALTGTTASAVLNLGINSDAPTLISQVVANYSAGQTYNGISAEATANRSLQLEATVDDITGGEVTVYVEFMI